MGLSDGIALGIGFAFGSIMTAIVFVLVLGVGARILAGRDE